MRSEIEQAVQLLRRGDDAALEQALPLLQNTVFSFSMRVCGQREDAEDTMQEVLLKSVPYLPKFDSPKALVVWLYKVAKNRCLMSRRRSKFAPDPDLSLEELMPDRKELERLGTDGSIEPMFIHDKTPPGVPTMTELRDQIHYDFEPTDSGGRVRIHTSNARAVEAVHEFLRFQITEHQTGDPMSPPDGSAE